MTDNRQTLIPATGSSEQHHGDLRKGAFLQRRAAYWLRADTCFNPGAGKRASQGKDTT